MKMSSDKNDDPDLKSLAISAVPSHLHSNFEKHDRDIYTLFFGPGLPSPGHLSSQCYPQPEFVLSRGSSCWHNFKSNRPYYPRCRGTFQRCSNTAHHCRCTFTSVNLLALSIWWPANGSNCSNPSTSKSVGWGSWTDMMGCMCWKPVLDLSTLVLKGAENSQNQCIVDGGTLLSLLHQSSTNSMKTLTLSSYAASSVQLDRRHSLKGKLHQGHSSKRFSRC